MQIQLLEAFLRCVFGCPDFNMGSDSVILGKNLSLPIGKERDMIKPDTTVYSFSLGFGQMSWPNTGGEEGFLHFWAVC